MKRITCTFLLLCALVTLCRAQQGLAIQKAYTQYGYLPEAREVKLSGKAVARYKLSLFHSLDISSPTAQQKTAILAMLKADTSEAQAAEVKQLPDGSLQSAFYSLPARKGTKRYIFYKMTEAGQLSLIYIEGKASLQEMKERFTH